MRFVSSLLVAVSTLSLVQAADDVLWHKIVSKEGSMGVMFPGKPTVKKEDGSEQYMLEADEGASVYLTQWNKMKDKLDTSKPAGVKKFMDILQNAVITSLEGGKLVSSEDYDFADDVPAREIDISVPSLGIYRVNIICDGERTYQMTVLGKTEFVDGDDSDAFMQSFRLIEE